MRRMRFVQPPAWWPQWCGEAGARLPPAGNPFRVVYADGTLSSFVLPAGHWEAREHLPHALQLIRSLARVQTAKPHTIQYGLQTNGVDLDSGLMLLDQTVISPCPHRPHATFTERLDILAGLCLHEVLHLQHSCAALTRQGKARGPLFGHLHNILEDEFIESRLPACAPGYVPYLLAARAYMFEDAHQANVQQDDSLLNTFLLMVRYPRRVQWEVAGPYRHELAQIRDVLTPFPDTPEAVFQATETIQAIFEQRPHPGPEPTKGLWQFLQVTMEQNGAALKRTVMIERARRLATAPSTPEPGRAGGVTWTWPTDHAQQYATDRAAVRPYIAPLRRWLREWEGPVPQPARGRLRGQLDRRQLHAIPRCNPHVFQRPAKLSSRRLTLALLIDESGSMDGKKIVVARQVAVLFKEALCESRNIDLLIFGHTADQPDDSTNIFCYWGLGSKRPYSLGQVRARRNNRDGVAIAAVANAVKQHRRNREIILLIVSDGGPNAKHYGGEAAVEHTRAVVKNLQNDMALVQIAIEPFADSARIFEHHIRFTDLAALPRDMMRLLRQLLG